MRGLRLAFSLAFLLAACGKVDVVKGSIQGAEFEEVFDVTFDKDTVEIDGVPVTVGMTVLYGGANGFCEDLNDALNGDQQATNRILSLDQLIIVNIVNNGQNPDLVDAAVNPNNSPFVFAVFDPSQSDGIFATAGEVTMDFDTGEGSLDVEFGDDRVSVDIAPLNFQCSGMAALAEGLLGL